VLWYLPFESLPVPASSGGSIPLLMHVPIRYAPTLALAVPDQRGLRPAPRTAVVAGKLLPREDEAFTKASLEAIVAASGDVAVLRKELPAPSGVLAATLDRLIVLADGDDAEIPARLVAARRRWRQSGSTLGDWPQPCLAAAGVLLDFARHENGLKKGGAGEEVFLAVCGLMGSGCRTVLLSRWRVGGQTSVDLVREFVQELPHESAATAWRRSVQLAADRPLDPAIEGRLRPSPSIDGLKADHPFFWSGYLLADRGQLPARDDHAPEERAKATRGR
jgi:hypothetical protein